MSEIFETTVSFEDLGLRDSLLKGLSEAGFDHPTHIQAQLIPVAGDEIEGHWGPWPIPDPGWWLLRLAAPCGAPVPDGAGPPVVVPPCAIEENPFRTARWRSGRG